MTLYIHTGNLSDAEKQRLQTARPVDELLFRHDVPEPEQQAAFGQAEAVLGNPPLTWWQTNVPDRLRFWQLDSAGFDTYRSLMLNVPVCNMGDWFAWPCAETIVAGILAHYRHIDELAVLQHQRRWVGAPIRFRMGLLRGKSVVVLGLGTIGLAVQQMLGGFGCSIKTMARTNPNADLHTMEELMATLPHTDLVINCLPGTARGFFSAALIAAMKPGSVFANVGRGSTVDEVALLNALETGHLSGAILDVTEVEPLPAEHPFWAMPQVLLTQHTAGGQADENRGKIDLFLRNLAALETGQPLENEVSLTKGY
jgi:glyoxylate/hydroxypyruvate reductase